MEGIAAATARIHQIESMLGITPRGVRPPTASLDGSQADFASVLAAQTGQAGPTAGSGLAGAPGASMAAARVTGVTGVTGAVGAAGAAGAVGAARATAPDPKLTPEQRGNAEAIVAAGAAMGLSLRDQAIGVMTAMGESSLRVIDYGDKAGPDSRGLFQQRDNGAWGTYADRMDPTRSAQSFYRALERVGGRDSMSPTMVAHTVQRNADPNHYTRWWDDAVGVVSRITGASPTQIRG